LQESLQAWLAFLNENSQVFASSTIWLEFVPLLKEGCINELCRTRWRQQTLFCKGNSLYFSRDVHVENDEPASHRVSFVFGGTYGKVDPMAPLKLPAPLEK